MRQGISITVDAAARARLAAIVADRNRPQKHVWRARIILLTADGVRTSGSRTWSLRSPWPDPCSWSQDEALTPVSSLRCHRCRLDAPGSRRSPDPGRLRVIPSSNPIILNEASRGEQARQDQHGSHVHGPMSPRPRCFWTSAGGPMSCHSGVAHLKISGVDSGLPWARKARFRAPCALLSGSSQEPHRIL